MADVVSRSFEGQPLLDAVAATEFAALGFSRQGRPIVGHLFGPAAPIVHAVVNPAVYPGQRLLVVGGVHGDEPSSVEAVLELAARFGAIHSTLAGSVLVVPALNPDGLAVGQKNASSNVDLNRNFPARNFTREHRAGYDPGPFPLSEPETAVLARVIAEHAIDAVVSVHAPFACVNFDGPGLPWAQRVAAASGWPVRPNIGYPTPGSLGSWLGGDESRPILTLELPPGPLSGFRAAAAAALDAATLSIKITRSSANLHEIG